MSFFVNDFFRMTEKKWGWGSCLSLLLNYDIAYLYIIRMKHSPIRTFLMKEFARKYGLEILSKQIGPGLYLGHAHNINVHPEAIIGMNCNLNKGCTIGRENRGKRNGAPVLGNMVWIGSNATVVGAVTIGNDVLIAPNSYVNFDVPDHSIVVGNPGKIIHKDYATEQYIKNIVEL